MVRVAKALELLPLTDEAFNRGELFWTAVRVMTRVATPQTEEEWVSYARRHRVSEVERRVAASKPGDEPGKPGWGGLPVRRLAPR